MKVLFRKKKNVTSERTPEIIYNNFAENMFRLCYRYLHNEADAEEVMNDAFIKIFKAVNNFEDSFQGSFEAWVKRIMINEAISFIRKKGNYIHIENNEDLGIESDITIDENQTNEYYYNLIRQLPDGYRTIFNLYAIEGYSHKEIANLLGISESASRSQLSKARSMLKRKLKVQNHVDDGQYR